MSGALGAVLPSGRAGLAGACPAARSARLVHEAVTLAAGECSRGRRCCVPVVGFGAAEKHVAAGDGGVCVRCPWDPRGPRAPRTCRRAERRVAGPAARAVALRQPGVLFGAPSRSPS